MKEKITEHGIRLFQRKGFTQTSIQDIVDAMNVTKGTFYYYFSSKEELLMDIHLRYIDDLLYRQGQILENEKLTNKEKLYEVVKLLIKDIRLQGPSGRVFFREMRHLNEENTTEIRQKRVDFRKNIESILQSGVASGEFKKELKTDITSFAILGMTNWSYEWFHPDGETSEDELIDIYMNMITKGIER